MTAGSNERPNQLELAFDSGQLLTATLLWDRAPCTCAAIVNSLPITAEARHAQWAGEEFMFSQFPVSRTLPIENQFVWREPDYVLTNKHPGGVLAFYPSLHARSFCVLYGEVVPRCAADLEVAVTVFATIDQPELAADIGRAIRTNGCLAARISAIYSDVRGGE